MVALSEGAVFNGWGCVPVLRTPPGRRWVLSGHPWREQL